MVIFFVCSFVCASPLMIFILFVFVRLTIDSDDDVRYLSSMTDLFMLLFSFERHKKKREKKKKIFLPSVQHLHSSFVVQEEISKEENDR